MESAVAIGVAPPTVTDTVADSDSLPSSSSTVYATLDVPSKSASGSKVSNPAIVTIQMPSVVVSED